MTEGQGFFDWLLGAVVSLLTVIAGAFWKMLHDLGARQAALELKFAEQGVKKPDLDRIERESATFRDKIDTKLDRMDDKLDAISEALSRKQDRP